MDYHFFFSYSRIDHGSYLEKFFSDLRTEVYKKVGLKEISLENIAFRDQSNIEVGEEWPNELIQALNFSKTLVCIYTPAYFRSEYCGKEVQVFHNRLSMVDQLEKPTVLIPVLWENPKLISVPQKMQKYQFTSSTEAGNSYQEKGLYYLIKLNKYQDEYQILLDHLATRIVLLASTNSLPTLEKFNYIEEISNFFEEEKVPSESNETFVPTLGPRLAQFIFVVGNRNELSSIRNNIECYGDTGWEWRPFHTEDYEAGILAQKIATEKKVQFANLEFAGHLIEKIKDAENNNSIVIIIVDPWSVTINSYKNFLSEYDNSNYINSGVIIPWDLSDGETEQTKEALKANIYEALCHCIIGNRSGLHDDIFSIEDFEESISIAIDEARSRIMKFAKVYQKIEGDTSVAFPMIMGPR